MKEQFKNYLIERGYSQYTPSGHPSTVYDYIKRIDYVCALEGNISWEQLAADIPYVVQRYDTNGNMEHEGNKSHRAVISALVQFKNFICD
jgi:hypothetical protein